MSTAILYVKHPTSGQLIPVLADADGKLRISDADPFTVAQDTPENLKHVPHGYDTAGAVYRPYAVDADGKLLLVSAITGNLDDLDDVNVPTPTDGYVLTYDQASGLWIAQAIPAAAWADITGKPTSPSLEELATEHEADGTHGAITPTSCSIKYTNAEAVIAAKTVKLDDFAAPDDNIDLNASASAHGLLPKLSGAATDFLSGLGTWLVPAGGGAGPTIVLKTATESVISSTTLQNDDELVLPVGANELWELLLYLRFNRQSGGVQSSKFAFSIPSGGSIVIIKSFGAITAESDGTTTTPLSQVAAPSVNYYLCRELYVGGASAGNVQLQWAQQTSENYYHYFLPNSFIIAHQLA